MQKSIKPGLRTGDVGWSRTTTSAGIILNTCCNTAQVLARSVARFFGRSTTSAPQRFDRALIPGSSVETTKWESRFAFFAASMLHAIRGFPPTRQIFFWGIPLLPPRAGMTPKTLTGLMGHHLLPDNPTNVLQPSGTHLDEDGERNGSA